MNAPGPAVAAFLRGVERRALLLGEAQSGDGQVARRAFAASEAVFPGEAAQWPIAQWPRQFWRLLLSAPAFAHKRRPEGRVLPELAVLPPATRAAVLLHLVAGLADEDAAAALGVTVEAFQGAIRDALPRNADGQPDLDAWRQWRDAAVAALAGYEAAAPIAGDGSEVGQREPVAPGDAPAISPGLHARRARDDDNPVEALPWARRHRRWLWLAVALCAGALVATFFVHPAGREMMERWRSDIRVEPLPAAAAPKSRYSTADTAGDPDRELIANPGAMALARRAPFLSWLAAGAAERLPVSAAAADGAGFATMASAAWRALAPAERGRQRQAWSAWQSLPAGERQWLSATARRLATLPAEQQQALATEFAALPHDARRGWELGPVLGPAWPRVAPLFAYVDAEQRTALLRLLRDADAAQFDALARLAQSTPPEGRAALRDDLLRQPAGTRLAWMQRRLQAP